MTLLGFGLWGKSSMNTENNNIKAQVHGRLTPRIPLLHFTKLQVLIQQPAATWREGAAITPL